MKNFNILNREIFMSFWYANLSICSYCQLYLHWISVYQVQFFISTSISSLGEWHHFQRNLLLFFMVDYLQSGLLWLSSVLAANVVLLSSNRQKPLLPQSFYFHETYIFSYNELKIFLLCALWYNCYKLYQQNAHTFNVLIL
jgi:hypothetical protein